MILKKIFYCEETDKGLLLRNKEEINLSWGNTYKFMANVKENWDDFGATIFDGMEDEGIEY